MTLQTTGAISASNINNELTQATDIQLTLNDTNARKLAGKTTNTSQISYNDFYGKTNYTLKIVTAGVNFNLGIRLSSDLIMAGWDQISPVQFIIPSGAYYAGRIISGTYYPAFEISGTYPNGLTIINNGYILGKGGTGGAGGSGQPYAGAAGDAGGNAIYIPSTISVLGGKVTIINNGVIAGGGGGGGGGGGSNYQDWYGGGGGGGGCGGGVGGAAGTSSGPGTVTVGAGASLPWDPWTTQPGAGGKSQYGKGGDGGNYGQPGSAGTKSAQRAGGAGGAAGNYIVGNTYVNWGASGPSAITLGGVV